MSRNATEDFNSDPEVLERLAEDDDPHIAIAAEVILKRRRGQS